MMGGVTKTRHCLLRTGVGKVPVGWNSDPHSAWELASHQPLPRSQMPANSPPPVPMIAVSCVCLSPLSIKLGRKLFGLNFHITVHHRGNRIGTQGRNLNQKP